MVDTQQQLQRAIQLQQQGQLQRAAQLYQQILQHDPQHESALVNLGILFFAANKWQEGLSYFQKAIQANPKSENAYSNMGYALIKVQKIQEAIPYLEKAVALDGRFFSARLHLANALTSLDQYEAAYPHFEQAYRLNPKHLEVLNNWAQLCLSTKRLEQAERILKHTIKLYPDRWEVIANLATLRKDQYRFQEAETLFQKVIHVEPAKAKIHHALAAMYHDWVKPEQMLTEMQEALRLLNDKPRVVSDYLFAMNYFPRFSDQELLEAHQKWQRDFAPLTEVMEPVTYQKSKLLRVGLLSGDFFMHPVTVFLLQWLPKVDKRRITFFAYAQVQREDEFTDAVREHTQWRIINGLSDRQVAEKVREDQIHILIDLAGHTKGNRLGVMGYRSAPVQVSYLGYVNTTGLPQIDYRIVDRLVNPPETQKFYTEKLTYLPDSYTCFCPAAKAPAVASLPAKKNGFITFGCLNNPAKINAEVVSVWSKILHSVKGSKIRLKARQFDVPESTKPILSLFEAGDIPADRVILEGGSPIEEYLASYHEVDIALDPFPYNGGTTTHDALYMGVPVIVLEGARYVSRMGVSILTNLGHPEWIARTPEEYIEKAVALAQDYEELATIRGKLRDEMRRSPLCDGAAFARSFTEKLETLYHQ